MLFIASYQDFKMETSFAKTLYTRQAEQAPPARSEEEMLDEHFLVETIQGRVKYKYTYLESYIAWINSKFCCCFKCLKCYKKR